MRLYLSFQHIPSVGFDLERPLLSMQALLCLLDLQRQSAITLSHSAIRDVVKLIIRHFDPRVALHLMYAICYAC